MDTTWAIAAAICVTLSLPLYLHGLWVILQSEVVTWSVLMVHLRSIGIGLVLTLVPVIGWMLPQLLSGRFSGLIGVHVFLALQSFAFLAIALWGIVPIFRRKRDHGLYRDPSQDIGIDAIDERMPIWRRRLRIGVFGYLVLWILSYLTGLAILMQMYL